MADTNLVSSPNAYSKRWLALPVAMLVTVASVIFLWRRVQQNDALEVIVPSVPEPIPVAIPQTRPPQKQPSLRWLLYTGLALIIVVLLILLEQAIPLLSTALFMLMVTVPVGYAGYRLAHAILHQTRNLRANLFWLGEWCNRHQDALSFVMVGIAVVCTIGSTIILKDSVSFSPLFGQGLLLFVMSLMSLSLSLSFKFTPTVMAHWHVGVDLPIPQTQSFHWWRAFRAIIATLVLVRGRKLE